MLTPPRLMSSSNLVYASLILLFFSRLRKQIFPCFPSSHIASSYIHQEPTQVPSPMQNLLWPATPAGGSHLAFCSPRQQAHFAPASPTHNYKHFLAPWPQQDHEVLRIGIMSYSSVDHQHLTPMCHRVCNKYSLNEFINILKSPQSFSFSQN